MLDTATISRLAEDVARDTAVKPSIERVMTQPVTDSEGKGGLRITFVIKPGSIERLSGDETLDLLVGIQRRLLDEGEERFPVVEYATEEELLEDRFENDEGQVEDDR